MAITSPCQSQVCFCLMCVVLVGSARADESQIVFVAVDVTTGTLPFENSKKEVTLDATSTTLSHLTPHCQLLLIHYSVCASILVFRLGTKE